MAEETQNSDANAQSAKGGGSGGMLPALLVIVLMPLISFAMFKFMFIPMIKAEIPEPGEPADINPADVHVKTDGELEMQKYDFDKVVANIKGTNMTRFVQAEITVYGSHPQMENKITENLEKLRDVANSLLSNMTLADFEKREIKNVIRNELKTGFNYELGEPIIEEIYIPGFVVQ